MTADVLFRGTVGGREHRAPRGLADLKASIMNRLMRLDPATRIHPGHSVPSTIGAEWETNRFVRMWRHLDDEGDSACVVGHGPDAQKATLVLWAQTMTGT